MYKAYSRTIFTLFIATMMWGSLHGQLADGAWAPPFTLKDINGEEHRLYDYLAEGKPVIIDLAAAWCGPCWEEHTSGVLDEIWEEYGPEGSDEIMILFIEADPTTSYAQLAGDIGPSQGNWIEGTPYPIIDVQDYILPSDYNLNFFPTILTVCPNMRVGYGNIWTNPENWTKENVLSQLFDCEGSSLPQQDAAVHTYDRFNEDCSSGFLDFKLYNTGTEPLTEANIIVKRDGQEVTTYNWTGNLATGEEADISLADIPLEPALNIFSVELATSDDDLSNNSIEIPFKKAPASSQELILYLQTDEFTEDHNTQWVIEDENGNAVAESGALNNNQYYQETIPLSSTGCHTFRLTDEGGDGLTNDGFVVLSDINDITLYDNVPFEEEGESIFQVMEVVETVQTTEITSLNIFPNPTREETEVNYELTEASPVNFQLTNLTGQTVWQYQAGALAPGQYQQTIRLGNVPAGVYLLQINTADGQLAKKIVKR